MKRTKRMAGLITLGLIMASFLVIGCGDSPNGPLIAGDDNPYVKPGNAGSGPGISRDGKGSEIEH